MINHLLKSLNQGGIKATKTFSWDGEISPSSVGTEFSMAFPLEVQSLIITQSKEVGSALRAEISFFDGIEWSDYKAISSHADEVSQPSRLRPSILKHDPLIEVINSNEGYIMRLKKPITVRGFRVVLSNGDTVPHRMAMSMLYTTKGVYGEL